MKYHYFYQSRENKSCDGWIDARDRNEAYAQLRKRGIKPYKLLGRNPMPWKRWAAIGVLAVTAAALAIVLFRELAADRREAFGLEDRSQIYGDPELLQELTADGWRKSMGSDGDAWFARHARPGMPCDCKPADGNHVAISAEPLRIESSDSPEVAKMKRLVNGMKREFRAYVDAGGSVEDYMTLCDERLRTELGIVKNIERELKTLESRIGRDGYEAVSTAWAKKNALLRSMGLPTVVMPAPVD